MRQLKAVGLHLLRFALYKSIALLKICRNFTAQMWLQSNLSNLYTQLSRSKKVILFVLALLVLLLYAWPQWLRWPTTRLTVDSMDMCLDAKLENFRDSLEEFNAVVSHDPPREDETPYLPYIGNGYIGSSVSGESQLYIKHGRALTLPVNYYPIVHVLMEGLPSKSAILTDVRAGLVNKIQCFLLDTMCVSVASQYYTHRVHSSVLIQEYRVHNPTDLPVTVEFRHIGVSDWQGSVSRVSKTSSGRNVETELKTIMGKVLVEDSQGGAYAVAVSHSRIHDMVTVKPGATVKRHMYTTVRYTEHRTAANIETDLTNMATLAETDLQMVLNVESTMLRKTHTEVWKNLWSSGFGISMSRAEGALNGDRINMTMYYVVSNAPAYAFEKDREAAEVFDMQKMLYYPDRCYEGHHTLQNSKMWERVLSVDSMLDQVRTWLITLEKQGCAPMLRAGAEGIIQAMMLSFGALRFKNDHLEFAAHPKDLHRDYFFRRVNYGNNTHVNISVVVGEDNKANLYVALDRNDKPYFACDAGCVDTPVKLSNELEQFPVKLTDPQTAILYITYDKQHMNDLKLAIHVNNIVEAPAHEHHVIALHRHGHHYGGLPMLFWISIGFLILVFHLFLFKLIFNEYCQGTELRYSRGKYNL